MVVDTTAANRAIQYRDEADDIESLRNNNAASGWNSRIAIDDGDTVSNAPDLF